MWQQTGSFRNATGSISGVSFDAFEERLWITDSEGYISSHSLPVSTPSLSAYTSSRACFTADHNDSAWGITNMSKFSLKPSTSASGISVPIGSALRLYSREGSLTADIPVSTLKNSSQSTVASVAPNLSSLNENKKDEKPPQPDESILCSLGIDTNELDPSIGSYSADRPWRTSKILVGGRLPSLYVLDSTKLFSSRDLVQSGKGVGSPSAYSVTLHGGGGVDSISPLRTLQKQPIRILATLQVDHPVMHLCHSENRSIVAANSEGPQVSLFDGLFRSSASTGSLSSCHAGGITSIDSSHTLIATCGNTTASSKSLYSQSQATSVKGKGGSREGAFIDPIVKIYDNRMSGRVLNSFTVPIGNGLIGSGPIFVKFMPHAQEVIYSASPPLLIGTSDGRFFVAQDASSTRRIDPLAQVDLSVSALLRNEEHISRDSNHPQITCITLASSGLTIAAGDADGTCHLISPMTGASTSRLGGGNYFCQPGVRYHGADAWISSTDLSPESLTDATITEAAVSSSNRSFEINQGVTVQLPSGGNAGTFDELKKDSSVDSVFLQGSGYDVPVAAPGLSMLSPLRDSWTFGGRIEKWNKLWSVPLGAMQGKSVGEMLKHSPLYTSGENEENAAHIVLSQQLQQHQRVVPGLYLASTLPEWTSSTIMVPPRRRIVDQLLLQMAVKPSSSSSSSKSSSTSTLSYVNNRMPDIGVRPNSLIFGKRRGYVSSDPRRKAEKSSFVPLDANGKVKMIEGRERGSSIDSLSTTGSFGDLRDFDGIRDEFSTENEYDIEDEEMEGVVVLTEDIASASTSPPQAYSRPIIKRNPMFGYEVDFSSYNHCPPTLGPFAGFDEVGPNSFVNAALQMLFFCSPLRARIQRHICSAPACVACELRFVFDTLCQAPVTAPDARVASAQPLLRTLHNVTEVSRLGLLHPSTLDPPKRMELLVKVLLEKLSRETQYLTALQYKEVKDATSLGTVINSSAAGSEKSAEFLIHTPWDSALSSKAIESAVTSGVPLHLADVSGRASVDDLISFRTTNVTTCTLNGHESAREGSMKMIELVYPDSSPPSSSPSFSSLLSTALITTRHITRAWCEECSSYIPHKETRCVSEIGDLFFVSTCLASHTVAQQQKEVLAAESKASSTSSGASETTTAADAPLAYARQLWADSRQRKWLPTLLKITYGNSYSSSTKVLESTPVCVTEITSEPMITDADGVFSLVGVIVHVAQTNRLASTGTSSTNSSSSLRPPSSTTEESAALKKYHFTSCLKLRNDGAYGPSSGDESSWVIFNHFRITPATEGEVLNFASNWKTPCVLLYQRLSPKHPHPLYRTLSLSRNRLSQQELIEIAKRRLAMGFVYFTNASSVLHLVKVLQSSIFLANQSTQLTTCDSSGEVVNHLMLTDLVRIPPSVFAISLAIPHQPLLGSAPVSGANTVPVELASTLGSDNGGGLVAIDSEFVIVSTERSKILPDGSRRILVPARSMPGRVSVIRADGSVLLDSYLCAAEKVVDHLTRFSGIYEGDLDPKTSSHRLLTQKEMHLRLRALIDNGVTFVGHGLRKDCRELNIVIPRQQTIDTVRLYQLPSQRFLSLKFLTSHVLNASIQAGVHDSCEDAHFSMQLYQKYLSLKGRHSVLDANAEKTMVDSNDGTKIQKDDFEELLHKLYDQGRSNGWRAKIVSSSSRNPSTALLPATTPASSKGTFIVQDVRG